MRRLALVLSLAIGCTPDKSELLPGGPEVEPPEPVVDPVEEPVPQPPSECLATRAGGVLFGTASDEELRDVAITSAGTIVAVGYDRATFSPHGLVGGRGIVLELAPDLAGTSQAGVLDSAGTDSLESISIAPDTGKLWVVGRTNGELPDMPGYGDTDWVVGEVTSTGGLERRARGLEQTSEYARRVAVGTGGLLAIVGHEQASSMDPFLAVYDMTDGSGSPVWFTSRRVAADESYRAVAVSDAQVVVGGDIADGAEQGTYITAWDRDAGRLWRRQLSQHGADTVTGVKILPNGNVLWAGSSTSPIGDLDAVVGVLDGTSGTPLWTKQYGAAEDEQVAALAVDDSGRIAIVGNAKAPSRIDVDAFLLVLDASGTQLHEEIWTSDGDDRPTAVAMDSCGGIVLVGATNGDLIDTAKGGRDAFVLVTHVGD